LHCHGRDAMLIRAIAIEISSRQSRQAQHSMIPKQTEHSNAAPTYPAGSGAARRVRATWRYPDGRAIRQYLAGLAARTHIVLPCFAALLIALIGVTTLRFIDAERTSADEAARAATAELADAYAAQAQRSLATIDSALKSMKYAVNLKGQSDALSTLNQQGLTPSGLIFTVYIVDRNGIVVASNLGAEHPDLSRQSNFQFHQKTNNKVTFVSGVERGNSAGESLLAFSRRLNDTDGRFAGIVAVAVEPAYLTGTQDYPRLGKLGALGIHGEDGVVRAVRIGERVSWGQKAPHTAAQSGPAGPAAPSWDGVRRYVSARPIGGIGLVAFAGLAESEQMAVFEARRRSYVWIALGVSAGLALVVALLCAWSWQITRARRRTHRAEQTFAAASMASLDAFFVLRTVLDKNRVIVDFLIEDTNTRAQDLVGMDARGLQGKRLTEVIACCRTNGVLDDLITVTTRGGVHESEREYTSLSGGRQWLHQQVVAVDDGVVAIMRDITERKLNEQAIQHQADHDPLTGLPNRSLVRSRLEAAISLAAQRSRTVTLVFIDLDGFKRVNDTLGHAAGDELLQIVARRMTGGLRREDTLGRFGGDEFVIVFGDQDADLASRRHVLERIRDRVNEPIRLDDREVTVGCSMGVAVYPDDGCDAATLIDHADIAMYRAKQLGKNNVQLYSVEPA
jgi:diguanylate cyclase (GGDEF)-like protein/PAS domain S-box-containing protein